MNSTDYLEPTVPPWHMSCIRTCQGLDKLGNNCSSFSLILLLLHWLDALTRDGEVLWIEGAFFPLEMGLESCQPQISQFEAFSPDVGDQESHLLLFLVSGYTEINVSGDTPCFVLHIIDVEQPLWFVQQGHPQSWLSYCSRVDKIIGGSTVHQTWYFGRVVTCFDCNWNLH